MHCVVCKINYFRGGGGGKGGEPTTFYSYDPFNIFLFIKIKYLWMTKKKKLAKGRIIQVNVKNYLCSCVSSQPTVLSLFIFPPL